MKTDLLLAIDAGTGSCRAILFDINLNQVEMAQREWSHNAPKEFPGAQDFDVKANWLLIVECIKEVIVKAHIDASCIKGISSTSMREGIVLFDNEGNELWACPNVDGRAGLQAEDLVASGAAEKIYSLSGDWVSITSPARIRWLAERKPELLAKASSMGLISDWITYKLTGIHITEPSCGSSSGMFELSKSSWSKDIIELLGFPSSALPKVVESGTPIGNISQQAAKQTGLSTNSVVVAGGADTQLALLGAGIETNQLAVIAGSFWQTAMTTESPLIDPKRRLRTLCHAKPGQWMIEGIGFYSGLSLRWVRDALCELEIIVGREQNRDPYELMEELASQVPPGSNGVLAILSNIMNARRWVHASPSFLQFDLNNAAGTGRAAFIRSVQEAGAYVARAHMEIISEVSGKTFSEFVFTGGASKGKLWPQILTNTLNLPLKVPVVTESTSLGAAVLAGVGSGVFKDLDHLPKLNVYSREIKPNKDDVDTYARSYKKWQDVYGEMLDISERNVLKPMWRAAGSDVTEYVR